MGEENRTKSGNVSVGTAYEIVRPAQIAQGAGYAIVPATIPDPTGKEREEQDRTRIKKQEFLDAFPKNRGVIYRTAEAIGISDSTFYEWRDADPEFAKAVKAARAHLNSKVEDVLMKKVFVDEDGPSVRFYLERRDPEYKAKNITEVVAGVRTLEDILDQAEAEQDKQPEHGDHRTTAPQAGPADAPRASVPDQG